jgi:undecaprenol kinase
MLKIKRLYKSFRYASRGLVKTFQEEQNLQVQSIIAILIISLGFFFRIDRISWIVLIMVIGLVFLMELVNSAIERIADALKPRIDCYVKEIKDIMAAAVFLASLISIIVGIAVFYPYLKDFLNYWLFY